MAMNINKANIISAPVNIFVAERTSEGTPVTPLSLAESAAGGSATWKFVGGTQEESTKIGFPPEAEHLQDGTPKQTGGVLKLETKGLETDYAKIQTLESFLEKTVDIICVEIGTSKGHRLQRMGLLVGAELLMSRKKANTLLPVAERVVAKLTDGYDIVTLS
jgi:hypothetical protein